MSWVRIHDGAMSSPKVVGLIDWHNPFCLWVWGLSYSQSHLTDGVIPRVALPNPIAARTSQKLLKAKLWEHHPEGYLIHDYLDWNDSRAFVSKKRQEARDRMKFARTSGRSSREHPKEVRENFYVGVGVQNEERTNDPQGTSREVRANTTALDPAASVHWFDRIYAAYPNKARKLAAAEQWTLLGPDLGLAQTILSDIQRRLAAGWVRLERRFIPQLVRFLEERQWEDMPEVGPIFEEDSGLPHAWQCGKCGEIHEGTQAEFERKLCPQTAPRSKATGEEG